MYTQDVRKRLQGPVSSLDWIAVLPYFVATRNWLGDYHPQVEELGSSQKTIFKATSPPFQRTDVYSVFWHVGDASILLEVSRNVPNNQPPLNGTDDLLFKIETHSFPEMIAIADMLKERSDRITRPLNG